MSSSMEKKQSGHRRLYTWDKWFSSKTFKLTKGKHFNCQVHSMIAQIRNRASEHHKKVSVQVFEDTLLITVLGDVE